VGHQSCKQPAVSTGSRMELTWRGCGAERSAYDTLSDENERYNYDIRLHKARADTADGFTGLPVVRSRLAFTSRHFTSLHAVARTRQGAGSAVRWVCRCGG
jgi:hypothetical protein